MQLKIDSEEDNKRDRCVNPTYPLPGKLAASLAPDSKRDVDYQADYADDEDRKPHGEHLSKKHDLTPFDVDVIA